MSVVIENFDGVVSPILEQPKEIVGAIATDDRGCLRFVNNFDFSGVKRFYQVENHSRNFIRAWHGHKKEGKYVYVARGSIFLAAFPLTMMDAKSLKTFTLSANNPKVLYIPPGYYNGFKTLTDDTLVMFFSTSTLEESKGDDERLSAEYWNDIWKENYR